LTDNMRYSPIYTLTLTDPTTRYTWQCWALHQAKCWAQTDMLCYKVLCNFP